METTPQSTCGAVGALCLQVILLGRIAGKIGNHRMSVLQVEYLKNGVGGLAILTFDNGILDAFPSRPCCS